MLNILYSAGISAALLAIVAWLMRSWITERLKNAIRHEYDRELEHYKSVLSLVHSATAEGQKAAIEARLKSFDRLWKSMLAVRNNTGTITMFLDILTVDEYATLKSNKNFIALTGALDDARIQAMVPDNGIEEARPYVGELLWALFFAYQAINMRIVILAWWSANDEAKINWHKDPAMRGLLAAALTKDELAQMDAMNIGKIGYLRRTIELKVLSAGHRLFSGAEFGEEAVRQASVIIAAANNSLQARRP